MVLEQNWRWFGPNDPIKFEAIKQAGAEGIVTALHHIPTGEIWTVDDITKRKQVIESEGLRWSVAESITVHEDIKKRSGNYKLYIENYKESIRNLGKCGVDIVSYHFMPVLDWSRTDLNVKFKDGSLTTRFETKVFAAFDIFILRRPNAEQNYSDIQIQQAEEFYNNLDEKQKEKLIQTMLLPFPGTEESFTLEKFRATLEEYKDIKDEEFRENLYSFIKEIVPVAEESGVFLAIHPDDPPMSLLGLPRIVSNKKDIENILSVTDSPYNGITLCTGALGAGHKNNLVDIAQSFAKKVNFIHLRNVTVKENGDFIEDNLLDGTVDIYNVMKTLLLEQKKRKDEGRKSTHMPIRPDHGHLMFPEQNIKEIYPGYSLFGRMRSLAELRGLELGIERSLGL